LETFAADGGPHTVIVDPSNEFLYATNPRSQEIATFRINSITGLLTPVPRGRVRTRSEGVDIAISSGDSPVVISDKFAYVSGTLPDSGGDPVGGNIVE